MTVGMLSCDELIEVRFLRPYALTAGRVRSHAAEELPLEALLVANEAGCGALAALKFERADVIRRCRVLRSVAEISAQLHLPLGVARVLAGDLHAEGLLDIHLPAPAHDGPDAALLGKVLDGLQHL